MFHVLTALITHREEEVTHWISHREDEVARCKPVQKLEHDIEYLIDASLTSSELGPCFDNGHQFVLLL